MERRVWARGVGEIGQDSRSQRAIEESAPADRRLERASVMLFTSSSAEHKTYYRPSKRSMAMPFTPAG